MRVLQVLGPSTGGIRRHVLHLASALEDRGWTVTVAGPAGVIDNGNPGHVAVPFPRRIGLRTFWRGRQQLRRLAADADVIHAHGLKAGWLVSTLRGRPPVVTTIHNVVLAEVDGWAAPFLRILERRLPHRVDRLIAVSAEIAGRVTGRPTANAAVVLPAGPEPAAPHDPKATRKELGVGAEPLVVTIARLTPQKDVPTLLRALAVVREIIPDVRAVVIGVGRDESDLRELATGLGLDATVAFLGQRDDATDILNAADAVVVSSRWEGSPLTVAEAMKLGRPVISTRVGSTPELITDGVSGRLVDVGDHSALGAAIVDVLSDTSGAATMGARARETAALMLDNTRLIDAVESVYKEVIPR